MPFLGGLVINKNYVRCILRLFRNVKDYNIQFIKWILFDI